MATNEDQNAPTTTSEPPVKPELKHLEFEGYKFDVDTDLLDDVDALDLIHQIEDKNRISAIVPLLHFLIGDDGYEKMKAHFVEKEGRFRASKLANIYRVIIENFDPKG